MMVIIRYISIVLVWILTILVIAGSIGKINILTLTPQSHSDIRFYSGPFNYILLIQDSSKGDSAVWSSAGGTGVLWWLYADSRSSLNNQTMSVPGKEVLSDNVKALLVYSIGATIFTVCLRVQLMGHTLVDHVYHLYQR